MTKFSIVEGRLLINGFLKLIDFLKKSTPLFLHIGSRSYGGGEGVFIWSIRSLKQKPGKYFMEHSVQVKHCPICNYKSSWITNDLISIKPHRNFELWPTTLRIMHISYVDQLCCAFWHNIWFLLHCIKVHEASDTPNMCPRVKRSVSPHQVGVRRPGSSIQ